MKVPLLLVSVLLPIAALSSTAPENGDATATTTVSSPENRVAVLELYTSEGCSSCPPADRFLSRLKDSGISDRHLIPMAFHVTYWDYIGWQDRFADKRYDDRQRELADKNSSPTVYTPQFLLSGNDYRRHASFTADVNKLASQRSPLDLALTARRKTVSGADFLSLKVDSDTSRLKQKNTGLYIVVLENNLSSQVDDGENEGETLKHDYVVRRMLGPYIQKKTGNTAPLEEELKLDPRWKKQDLSIVVFADDPATGEVLQAVRLSKAW